MELDAVRRMRGDAIEVEAESGHDRTRRGILGLIDADDLVEPTLREAVVDPRAVRLRSRNRDPTTRDRVSSPLRPRAGSRAGTWVRRDRPNPRAGPRRGSQLRPCRTARSRSARGCVRGRRGSLRAPSLDRVDTSRTTPRHTGPRGRRSRRARAGAGPGGRSRGSTASPRAQYDAHTVRTSEPPAKAREPS